MGAISSDGLGLALPTQKEAKAGTQEKLKQAKEGVWSHRWPLLLILMGLVGIGAGAVIEDLPSKVDYATAGTLFAGLLQFWFERQQKRGVGEVKEAVATAATAGVQTAVINLANRLDAHCENITASMDELKAGRRDNDERHEHLERRVANLEQGQTETQSQLARICGKLGV